MELLLYLMYRWPFWICTILNYEALPHFLICVCVKPPRFPLIGLPQSAQRLFPTLANWSMWPAMCIKIFILENSRLLQFDQKFCWLKIQEMKFKWEKIKKITVVCFHTCPIPLFQIILLLLLHILSKLFYSFGCCIYIC